MMTIIPEEEIQVKRYSQMEPEELKKTIDELKTNLTKAKTDQLISETEMLKQKIHLAESYLIDPKTIAVGKYYTMEGYTNLFHVDYLNGIYAWGTFEGKSEKEAFPLSLLHRNH
jgi:hypothetical protein